MQQFHLWNHEQSLANNLLHAYGMNLLLDVYITKALKLHSTPSIKSMCNIVRRSFQGQRLL